MEQPKLRRGPFGYTKRSVRALLSDRDRMFLRATGQARVAASRADEVEAALRRAEARIQDLMARVEGSEAEAAQLRDEVSGLRQAAARSDDHAARAARMELETRTAKEELLATNDELRGSRARVAELEIEMNALRDELEALREFGAESVVVSVSEVPSTTKELTGALDAAEQAVARIVEAARTRGEEELRQLELTREEMREEMGRLSLWRDRVSPTVEDLRTWIEETTRRTLSLGERIRAAVEPAAEALEDLSRRLAELSQGPSAQEPGGALVEIPEPGGAEEAMAASVGDQPEADDAVVPTATPEDASEPEGEMSHNGGRRAEETSDWSPGDEHQGAEAPAWSQGG